MEVYCSLGPDCIARTACPPSPYTVLYTLFPFSLGVQSNHLCKDKANMTDQPDLPHPPMFRYEDGNEIISEIYVAPGRHEEIKQLWETEQWNELAKFPRWSDRPPLPPRQPDSMTYTTPEGKERSIWLPEGSHGRVYELFKSEDWEGLERGFVQYSKFGLLLHELQRSRSE